jgi:ribosome recycling factor
LKHRLKEQLKGRGLLAKDDTYKEVRVFHYPGMTVRVHIPDLTEEELKRRRKIAEKAAADLLKEVMMNERKRENEQRKKAQDQKSAEA